MLDENLAKGMRSYPIVIPRTPTGLVIHEPSDGVSPNYASLDKEVLNEASMTFLAHSTLTSTNLHEEGESSKGTTFSYTLYIWENMFLICINKIYFGYILGRKRSREQGKASIGEQNIQHEIAAYKRIQARRDRQNRWYAKLTPEQRQAKRDREKARRQSLTTEERQEINAHRRVRRQNLPPEERNANQRARRQSLTQEERKEKNARRRALKKCLPPEERQALLDKMNANYATRRDTPCLESLAMQCPDGGTSSMECPEGGTSSMENSSLWRQTHNISNMDDGNLLCLILALIYKEKCHSAHVFTSKSDCRSRYNS